MRRKGESAEDEGEEGGGGKSGKEGCAQTQGMFGKNCN